VSELPPITVSSLDLERLEALLQRLPFERRQELEHLEAELRRANIVEPQEVPPTLVTMNSTVRFADEATGKEFERTLCYPHGMDGTPGKVSVFAPVGSALLGLSLGQHIDWELPGGGTMRVRIIEIVYQPERSGELNR
jgi:regulator of nucleoside diphosphate kinase